MLTYFSYDKKHKKVTTIPTFSSDVWVHAENPTSEEKIFLEDTLNLDKGHITDALDEDEVPRYEVEGDTIYIFIRFPHLDDELIPTLPFLLVLKNNTVVTITLHNPRFMNDLLQNGTSVDLTDKAKAVIYIHSEITKSYYNYFNTISKEMRHIRRKIERINNKNIVQFVGFEEILNDFRPSLTNTDGVLSKVQMSKKITFNEEELERIEDIHLSNHQLIDNCNDTLDTIRNIREAYTTILSNNLNNVIKLFTSLTVILTLPTIIASLYGMNVSLPFDKSENAFIIILLIIIASVSVSLYLFRKKDWL